MFQVLNKIYKKTIMMITIISICSGCATAVIRVPLAGCTSGREDITQIYPATTTDLTATFLIPFASESPDPIPIKIMFFCGGLIDLPASLIFDTLFLPYDCYRWANDEDWSTYYGLFE